MGKRTKKKKRGARKRTQAVSKPNTVSQSDAGSTLVKQETKPKLFYETIPKRESEKREKEKGSIFKYFNVASQFLRESKMELKKVKWPTRKELLASTAMVIFLVLVVSFFLGLIDFGLIKVIRNIVG